MAYLRQNLPIYTEYLNGEYVHKLVTMTLQQLPMVMVGGEGEGEGEGGGGGGGREQR